MAIKILLDPLAQNKEFIKRFEREAMIAAKLSHNNVVNAIDAGQIDGHYYFVMEYVEGPTIKDYPRQEQDLRRERGAADHAGDRRGARSTPPSAG